MMQKKICMLGGFAVGKTSLVRRFVRHLFSDQYQTTIGVTVEKKTLTVDGQDLMLMLWDLYGEDEFQRVRESYLRGSSGYILVIDGTRQATLDTVLALQQTAVAVLGHVPFVLMINKVDLRSEWEIDEAAIQRLQDRGWRVVLSSAQSGQGVEEALGELSRQILASPPPVGDRR